MSTHPCTLIIHANGRNVKRFSQNSAFFIEPARQVPKAPFPGGCQISDHTETTPAIRLAGVVLALRLIFSVSELQGAWRAAYSPGKSRSRRSGH